VTDNDEMQGIEELLAAYAIDALDDVERSEVDIYLEANPARWADVVRLTAAFDELVVARVPAASPPPDLWDRIADRLADEGKAQSVRTPSIVKELSDIDLRTPTITPADGEPDLGAAADPTDDLAARRARTSANRGTITALVLAAAAVVLVVLGLSLRPKGDDATMTAARAAQVATQPGSTSGSLQDAEGNLDMKVVLDAEGEMFVVPTRMPPLDDEHAYQLWALDSGTPVSLGVLRGAASMTLPAGEHPTKIAISKEPASGSPQPTTTPLAAGQLA